MELHAYSVQCAYKLVSTRPLIIKVRNGVLLPAVLVTLLILIDFFCFYFAGGGVIRCLGPRRPLLLN